MSFFHRRLQTATVFLSHFFCFSSFFPVIHDPKMSNTSETVLCVGLVQCRQLRHFPALPSFGDDIGRLSPAGSGHSHILRSKDYTPPSLASISRARPAPPQDAQQSSPSPYPHRPHIVYTVLFSRVAEALRSRITHSDTVKDRLTYRNALDGRQAVDEIAYVIKTTDRNLVPRALDEQKYFHAVTHHV